MTRELSPLAMVPTGTAVELAAIHLPESLRMHELGIRIGSRGIVAAHGAFGGVVLNIAGSRLAIDRRSAKLIEVRALAGTSTPASAGASAPAHAPSAHAATAPEPAAA